MIVALRIAAVALATLLILPMAAVAAGPLDGSYSLAAEGGFYPPDYLVVLQNDATIGLVLLNTVYQLWTYGVGTLSGNHATGNVFNPDQEIAGTFDLTFGAEGTFTGTLYDAYFEEATPVTGKRFF